MKIPEQKKRVSPVVILVDVSASMKADGRINQLNVAFARFIEEIKTKKIDVKTGEVVYIYDKVYLAVFEFSDSVIPVDLGAGKGGFTQASKVNPVMFEIKGPATHMGMAVRDALRALDDFRNSPSESDTRFYQPTVIIISDGEPNDEGWESAAALLKERAAKPLADSNSLKASVFLGVTGFNASAAAKFASDPIQTESGTEKFVLDVGINADAIVNKLMLYTANALFAGPDGKVVDMGGVL